jgi:hypothetical protein
MISCAPDEQTSDAVPVRGIGHEEMMTMGSAPVRRSWALVSPSVDEQNGQAASAVRVTVYVDPRGTGDAQRVSMLGLGLPRVAAQRTEVGTVFEVSDPGQYDVYLDQAPAIRETVTVDGKTPDLTVRLQLPSPTSIAGRVVDFRGLPVVDAWVQAFSALPSSVELSPAGDPQLTNSDGEFELNGAFAGQYSLVATGDHGEARLDAVRAPNRDLVLRWRPIATLSGHVTTRARDVVPSFLISYRPRGETIFRQSAGVDGTWSLPLLAPGTYELAVTSELGAAYTVVPLEAATDATLSLVVEPPIGAPPLDLLDRASKSNSAAPIGNGPHGDP